MKALIPIILCELQAGRCTALATVLVAKGSAPRGAGACMALFANGTTAGTVGGGVLEHRATLELRALLDTCASPTYCADAQKDIMNSLPAQCGGISSIHEYALTQDDVQNLGMVCGGNVSLLYQAFTPDCLSFFTDMTNALAGGGNLWLIRIIDNQAVIQIAFTNGTINPTALDANLFRALCGRKAVWYSAIGTQDDGLPATNSYFIEPVAFVSHAYLFGGGHVSQRVAPLLAQLDFAPVVYDDRAEFATQALFPTAADVICAPFAKADAHLSVTPDDEIVIMTRGHANDLIILTWALRTPAYYIGLIGSRSKIAHTRELLLQQGFTDADFARVHTPIGLPIRAETPMEIAVSVAAEMICCRAEQAEETSATV